MAKLYFSHDIDARNSEELMKVRMKLGPEGYAIYFMLLEKLADIGEHRLEEDYQLLSFDLRSDPAKIQQVAEDFGLFKHEGGSFWSSGLDKRINAAKDLSEKRRQAGRSGMASRWSQTGHETTGNSEESETFNNKVITNAQQSYNKLEASTKQTDSTKTLNININKNNNEPPQQQRACAREGCAEEEKKNSSLDLFSRFDQAMGMRYPNACVISATDDNRLRRYLTCTDEVHLSGMLTFFRLQLVEKKDVVGLRQQLEKLEGQGAVGDVVDFETWKMLTSLATLSRADQKKIRQMVINQPDGLELLKDALNEIEASKGKIKMPSRYIISKLKNEQ